MNRLTSLAGKMIIHMSTVPREGASSFIPAYLSSLQGVAEGDVIVMHVPEALHDTSLPYTYLAENQGVWQPETLAHVLGLKPRLVILPHLSIPTLNDVEHGLLFEHISTLLRAGIIIEAGLSMVEIAMVGNMLTPSLAWPAHAVVTGDYLRQHVGDYVVHDEPPADTLAKYYRGDILLPAPFQHTPAHLFNLASLIQLRDIMWRFVDSTVTEMARQANPAHTRLPMNTWLSLGKLVSETGLTFVLNIGWFVLVYIGWLYMGLPVVAAGFFMLAGPLVTALYVNPVSSMVTALISFAMFSVFFVPHGLTQPLEALVALSFLVVAVVVSYLVVKQHMKLDQCLEEAAFLRGLLRLTYDVSYAETVTEAIQITTANLSEALHIPVLVVDMEGVPYADTSTLPPLTDTDGNAAKFAMLQGSVNQPNHGSGWLWCPLIMKRAVLGAIGVHMSSGYWHTHVGLGMVTLLRAYSDILVMTMRRVQLREASDTAKNDATRETLRGALLSAMSHDLKTPLVSILGSLSSLRQLGPKLSMKDKRELLDTAYEESERLHAIIHNVLEMSRLESGDIRPLLQPVDVAGIVESLLIRCHRYYPKLRIVLTTPPPVPWVLADHFLLTEVLYNLMDNAAKYAGTKYPVEITISRLNGDVRISVADRGPGIPEGERSKVFDKYYRSARKDSSVAGSGLGLSIARAMVLACGGRVWVEKRPDGQTGTAILLELPHADPLTLTEESNHE